MGGNAFPNTIRLNKPDYESLSKTVYRQLQRPDWIVARVVSYSQKESFGDLDILFSSKNYDPELIGRCLGTVGLVRNGSVTSYAIGLPAGIFQVDVIYVPQDELKFATCYFAFNDLGNLLGRIYHRAGFKLGHRGLTYVVREAGNPSHVLREIVVTDCWKKALEWGGFDWGRWCEGFDSLEDIFRFVTSNPIACRKIFRLDEMGHRARIRDRKRKTYQRFLLWLEEDRNGIAVEEVIPKSKLREMMLEKALRDFPKFAAEFARAQEVIQQVRENRKKFNGKLVMEWTGLSGKELGAFMERFKKECCGGQTVIQWALVSDPTDIETAVRQFHRGI